MGKAQPSFIRAVKLRYIIRRTQADLILAETVDYEVKDHLQSGWAGCPRARPSQPLSAQFVAYWMFSSCASILEGGSGTRGKNHRRERRTFLIASHELCLMDQFLSRLIRMTC